MKYGYASIHGRFQPFHLGHFDYLLAALDLSDRIYIGLTRVLTEQGMEHDAAPHRNLDDANPLTYFERVQHIKAVLKARSVDPNRIDIGPFPIENPARLKEFWPNTLPCLTTQTTSWNDEKIRLLTSYGYSVEVLQISSLNEYRSGSEIRELIRTGDGDWIRYVAGAEQEYVSGPLQIKLSV